MNVDTGKKTCELFFCRCFFAYVDCVTVINSFLKVIHTFRKKRGHILFIPILFVMCKMIGYFIIISTLKTSRLLFIPCSARVTNTHDIKQNPFPGTVTSFIPFLLNNLSNWERDNPFGFDANVLLISILSVPLSGAEGNGGLPS